MNKLLVKASIDYADEFDCKMFGVFDKDKWESLCGKVKKKFEKSGDYEVEIYFGTNEALIFESYDSWLNKFKTTEITDEQAEFLEKNFGKTWGTGSGAFDIVNRMSDE